MSSRAGLLYKAALPPARALPRAAVPGLAGTPRGPLPSNPAITTSFCGGPMRSQLYVIRSEKGGPVKIGTSNYPPERLDQLQTAHPYRLVLIHTDYGSWEMEQAIHHELEDFRLLGEWFTWTPEIKTFLSIWQDKARGLKEALRWIQERNNKRNRARPPNNWLVRERERRERRQRNKIERRIARSKNVVSIKNWQVTRPKTL